MGLERLRFWASDWEEVLRLAAFGSSVFLLLAMFMPDWFARTSWLNEKKGSFTLVVDSPASYVGLLSLCGLVALFALVIGIWRRWMVAAALATFAFAGAAYVAGSSWWDISHGMALLDGRPAEDLGPPKWTIHWPTALPLFVSSAIIGTMSALGLAVSWFCRPED